MEPAFLKVIRNDEALRTGHCKAKEIHLRHLHGSPVLPHSVRRPFWRTPSSPPVLPQFPLPGNSRTPSPLYPAPTQAAVAPAVPTADSSRFHASGSQAHGRRHGEALSGAASPPSQPAGSRDSPPPETAGKLGRECQPSHSPPPRRPPAGRPSELCTFDLLPA